MPNGTSDSVSDSGRAFRALQEGTAVQGAGSMQVTLSVSVSGGSLEFAGSKGADFPLGGRKSGTCESCKVRPRAFGSGGL